jgi:tetratricopeptide (TPR) repeat protein
MPVSRIVLIVIAILVWNAPASAQSVEISSPSQPSSQPVDDPKISELISQLNDPDPGVREQATKSLWSRGRSITPKLREAAASGPPEVARRARSILRDFMYGLYPDTPKEIFNLLDQYRTGDLGQKQTAIWMLNSRGIAGLRVLLKLQDDERDEELKKMIARVLEPRAHDVAVMLIAEGETSAAEQNLESAAESASVTSIAAQDYAAFLATTGKLAARRQLLEAEPLTARNAVLRFSLARAAHDLPAAKAAAEKITDPDYLDSILVEQGDWAELARRLEKAPRMEPAERLGFLCTYYRLAGDEQNFRKTVELIIKRAQTAPQDYTFCSENLFLNSMPKEGEQVLLDHKDFLLASCYLGPRLELQKALELPELAQKGQPAEETKVRLRTVDALHFAGENEKARQALASAAGENRLRNDPAVWELLAESAMQMGRQDVADQYVVEILTKATNQDPLAHFFKKIHLDDGQAASQWWRFLRHERSADPVAQSFKDLRALYAKSVKPDELSKLSTAAEKYLAELQPIERESWQEAVGDIMEKNGQTDLAAQWFTKLASSTGNPRALIRVGDFEADRHNWTAAAQFYESAWERDYTRASALYLRGWALSQSGHSNEGRAMMEDADRLPLGSELARRDLMEAMQRHNLDEAVRHEVDLILTLTAPRSYERNETLRDAAELAAAKLDYAGAVNMWERAFLSNLTNDIRFEEPWANVVVPALIHRVRTLGLIQSGKIDAAVKEAKLTLELTPADADALIDFVNALDKSKHKVEADALYREQTDYYRKLTTDYRRSGPAHNQLAWSQVMCHRDLDDALANARKAVDLEPTSTASLDTLAEVYFAKGDAKSAAEQMQKCVDLEPNVARHRQQLARFQKALVTTTQASQ